MPQPLRVVVLKPSKYSPTGEVERFRWGFMPNSTVPHIRSMTPAEVGGARVEVHAVDEYVHTDLQYLSLLEKQRGGRTLLALVGVQSHQFHRALDLAAYARRHGAMPIIGGPHVMTCDTSDMHGRGVSFALAEAELIWHEILRDAARGELQPVYGRGQRWQQELESPEIVPPGRRDLRRYVFPMLGLYPARGCPFLCNFCSVTKIAGRRIRSQRVETTMASLRAAKTAGVQAVMFTSDNFNKYPDAEDLLRAMADERLGIPFFVQCDAQVALQEGFVELLDRAGCFSMFVGVESLNRQTLLAAAKGQNRPELYRDIVRLCRDHRISSHFSNIIGFPRDTESEILGHLDTLIGLRPTVASFYVLTPIPGTDQYDEFMARGILEEGNLDRYDGSTLTWGHPALSGTQLNDLLFLCYRKFFWRGHVAREVADRARRGRNGVAGAAMVLGPSLFSRYAAWRRMHPMSGGAGRVRRDGLSDFVHLRRSTFGFELAPLPKSLQLSAAEQQIDGVAQSRVRAQLSDEMDRLAGTTGRTLGQVGP